MELHEKHDFNIFMLHGTAWNCMKQHEKCDSNLLMLHGTAWNSMELHETAWNCMKQHGKHNFNFSCCMKLHETAWKYKHQLQRGFPCCMRILLVSNHHLKTSVHIKIRSKFGKKILQNMRFHAKTWIFPVSQVSEYGACHHYRFFWPSSSSRWLTPVRPPAVWEIRPRFFGLIEGRYTCQRHSFRSLLHVEVFVCPSQYPQKIRSLLTFTA
jgi:hypothetical protein